MVPACSTGRCSSATGTTARWRRPARRSPERDNEASLAAISERMIRDLQCIGTIEEVREQLRERAELGADLQLINMPRGDVAAAAKQLEADRPMRRAGTRAAR